MITDEQVETALRKWFKDEVTWDKGMAPWTADQFRVEMRAALEAALTLPSAGEAEPVGYIDRMTLENLKQFSGMYRIASPRWEQYRADYPIPLYTHPSPSASEAQVRVKPLEWSRYGEAKGGGAKYCVYEGGGNFGWNCVCYPYEDAQYRLATEVSEAEAKAAAQSDYEHRIRSALSTPEQGETPAPVTHVDGVELAARFVEKRLNDYCAEHGVTDPDTGTVEYPGNGEEYVYELEEIIEGIRALATTEGQP